jgi:hypothetical protein
MTGKEHCVVQRDRNDNFVGVVAGLGRNKGTWDTGLCRSSAYRYAAALRKEDRDHSYTVEELHG